MSKVSINASTKKKPAAKQTDDEVHEQTSHLFSAEELAELAGCAPIANPTKPKPKATKVQKREDNVEQKDELKTVVSKIAEPKSNTTTTENEIELLMKEQMAKLDAVVAADVVKLTTKTYTQADEIAEETKTYEWSELTKDAAGQYHKGDYNTLLKYMVANANKRSGYEVLRGKCIPYYDVDKLYGDGEDAKSKQEKNIVRDYTDSLAAVRKMFPDGVIYSFAACGYAAAKKQYKNSFHFRVRGAGYYPCGLDLPRVEGADTLVYRGVGLQQKFRLPFCDKDLDGRFLHRCEVVSGKFVVYKTMKACAEKLKEDFASYLVSNITGEHKMNVTDPINEALRVPRKEWISVGTLDEAKEGDMSKQQVEELVMCMVPEGKQEWDREFHRNFVWSMSQVARRFGFEMYELTKTVSQMSSKYGVSKKDNTSRLYELPPSKYGNTYGIGWLCNRARELNPDGYRKWRKDWKIKNGLEFFSDFRQLMKESSVSLNDIVEWAKACIIIIDNGGNQHVLTKNAEISDPIHPEIRTVSYKDVSLKCLLTTLDVNINYVEEQSAEAVSASFGAELAEDDEDNTDNEAKDTKSKKPKSKKAKKEKDQEDKPHPFCILKNAVHSLIKKGIVPAFNKIDFIPYGANEKPLVVKDVFNLFQGFRMANYKPKEVHDVCQTAFYKHIKEQLCAGKKVEFDKTIEWFAHMVQAPRELACIGLIFISLQGNGKDLLANLMEKIIGEQYYLSVENVDSFFSNFNTTQSGRLLIKLNELAEGGALSKNHNRYKGEMTKTDLWVEPKGIDKYKVGHYARYLHFSQHKNSITVERSDRRFFIVECKNDYANNFDYFKTIRDELNNPDIIHAWYMFFKNLDISKAKIQELPATDIKNLLKVNQTPSSLRYLIHMVNNTFEDVVGVSEDETQPLTTDFRIGSVDLYKGYGEWCLEERETAVRKQVFDNWIEQLGLVRGQKKINGKNVQGYAFKTDELQELFRKYLKIPDFKIVQE